MSHMTSNNRNAGNGIVTAAALGPFGPAGVSGRSVRQTVLSTLSMLQGSELDYLYVDLDGRDRVKVSLHTDDFTRARRLADDLGFGELVARRTDMHETPQRHAFTTFTWESSPQHPGLTFIWFTSPGAARVAVTSGLVVLAPDTTRDAS